MYALADFCFGDRDTHANEHLAHTLSPTLVRQA